MQTWLQEDTGQVPAKEEWQTIAIENGLVIQAQNPQENRVVVDNKRVKSLFKMLLVTVMVFLAVRAYVVGVDYFWLGMIL